MKKIKNSIYEWMLKHLPFKWMYKKVGTGPCHMMWIPRWGWSKSQLKSAKIRADELMKKIKWD